MTQVDKPRSREAQRKLRSSERRDAAMVLFCQRMAARLSRSNSPRDRRDVSYWKRMAAYFAGTEEWRAPSRKKLPDTKHLEFLARAAERVRAVQLEEVAKLRYEGLSWSSIGEAVGITRQAAVKRWPSADAIAAEMAHADGLAEAEQDEEFALVADTIAAEAVAKGLLGDG